MLEQDKKIKSLNKTDWYEWETICIRYIMFKKQLNLKENIQSTE